ncbi:SDR family NAD(P)-dependent oxidoreductase [Geodermatophilus sp. SYSU D00815]
MTEQHRTAAPGADQPLRGRVALVTGGGRGLGRAIALALAEAGADLCVAGRDVAVLDDVAAEAGKSGVRTLVARADVADPAQVESMVARTVEELGRLDVVVNNAGVLSSAPLLETTDDEWDRVLGTNLRGTFLVTRAAGRHLVAQGRGKVVNVASNYAFLGVPHHAAYTASKAAVVAFTRTMAVEWARHGVQVNALAPGFFATDLNADVRADEELMRRVRRTIPQPRIGAPDDLRAWAVLLASPASDFMTGAVITIDGGETAR